MSSLLRDLGIQLAVLNRRVVAQLDVKDIDLDCLDLVRTHGPLSASALARRAGLHPATLTGVLTRLERGGWVTRERDPADRRSVTVRARPEREGELVALVGGLSAVVEDVRSHFTDAELSVVADFLQRAVVAVGDAANDLVES
jgi:DNA-binding MarR family transcriptional regulator